MFMYEVFGTHPETGALWNAFGVTGKLVPWVEPITMAFPPLSTAIP